MLIDVLVDGVAQVFLVGESMVQHWDSCNVDGKFREN